MDPLKQEASVSSNEATRAAQDAQLQLAREELQRQKALFDQGLVSRQALDQANAAVDTAAASLKALQARERESRVELQYLPRHRAGRGCRGRHSRSRRGPRDDLDRDHHDQRQRRASRPTSTCRSSGRRT